MSPCHFQVSVFIHVSWRIGLPHFPHLHHHHQLQIKVSWFFSCRRHRSTCLSICNALRCEACHRKQHLEPHLASICERNGFADNMLSSPGGVVPAHQPEAGCSIPSKFLPHRRPIHCRLQNHIRIPTHHHPKWLMRPQESTRRCNDATLLCLVHLRASIACSSALAQRWRPR